VHALRFLVKSQIPNYNTKGRRRWRVVERFRVPLSNDGYGKNNTKKQQQQQQQQHPEEE
jgi:hypothetical protein